MTTALLRNITNEERLAYHRDGVVCLRKIIAPEWIEMTREGMDEMRAAPSPYGSVVDTGEVLLYAEQMSAVFNEKLRRVERESGTTDIAKQLYPAQTLRWMYDQLWYKGSGKVAETPWHQDTAYAYYDGQDIVRLWMPVDPVPRETTIEVVRGSHLWNVVYATTEPTVFEENRDSLTEGSFSYTNRVAEALPAVPDIETMRDSFDVIGYATEPGDVVVFNYHVLHHAGAGFNPNAQRRTYAILYADENTGLRKRPNVVPGMIEHVGRSWEEGQRLVDFPDLFIPA